MCAHKKKHDKFNEKIFLTKKKSKNKNQRNLLRMCSLQLLGFIKPRENTFLPSNSPIYRWPLVTCALHNMSSNSDVCSAAASTQRVALAMPIDNTHAHACIVNIALAVFRYVHEVSQRSALRKTRKNVEQIRLVPSLSRTDGYVTHAICLVRRVLFPTRLHSVTFLLFACFFQTN